MSGDHMNNQEKLDTILITVVKMEGHVDRNTKDLAEHIKRTNLLESKLQKIIYLLLIGAGIGMSLYGPQVLKLLGLII